MQSRPSEFILVNILIGKKSALSNHRYSGFQKLISIFLLNLISFTENDYNYLRLKTFLGCVMKYKSLHVGSRDRINGKILVIKVNLKVCCHDVEWLE